MDSRTVFLTGFMGAGKSTVGRDLAAHLGRQFFDTDELVVRAAGRPIGRIFHDGGEGAFREAEERVFDDLVPVEGAVVATGGGLFLGAARRRAMKRVGIVLWLDVTLVVALQRVGDGHDRPLWLADDPVAFHAWFQRRRATYALAHGRVDADGARGAVVRAAVAALERLAPGALSPQDP